MNELNILAIMKTDSLYREKRRSTLECLIVELSKLDEHLVWKFVNIGRISKDDDNHSYTDALNDRDFFGWLSINAVKHKRLEFFKKYKNLPILDCREDIYKYIFKFFDEDLEKIK